MSSEISGKLSCHTNTHRRAPTHTLLLLVSSQLTFVQSAHGLFGVHQHRLHTRSSGQIHTNDISLHTVTHTHTHLNKCISRWAVRGAVVWLLRIFHRAHRGQFYKSVETEPSLIQRQRTYVFASGVATTVLETNISQTNKSRPIFVCVFVTWSWNILLCVQMFSCSCSLRFKVNRNTKILKMIPISTIMSHGVH